MYVPRISVLLCGAGLFVISGIPAACALCVQHAYASGASLTITEVMYDVPGSNAGRQWIEIRNDSSSAITMTDKSVRLLDASGAHLVRTYDGSDVLAPEQIAIVAQDPEKFISDHGEYAGLLFKSAFSLKASGTITLTDTDGAGSRVTYSSSQGAKGDGNSLQRSGNAFIAGAPTPGYVPSEVPARIMAAMKPVPASKGSSKGRSKSKSTAKNTSKSRRTYDKGMTDPAATAEAATAGSLSVPRLVVPPQIRELVLIAGTASFKWFVALLAISGFSLIVLLRNDHSPKKA